MKTEIVKATDNKAIPLAAGILHRGGLIIYPTETSYGIAADATNCNAIKKIDRLKKRAGKFMPIIVSDMKMAGKYIVLNADIKKLMKKFMPGPLTLVAKKKNMRTARLLGGFRIPANEFALKLVKKFGKPITATSANMSGKPQIYEISEIKKIFSGKIDLIIDAGSLPRRKPSTVYDIETNKIVRKGRITEREIMKALKL